MSTAKNQKNKSQISHQNFEQTLLIVLIILFVTSLAYVFFVKGGLGIKTQLIEPNSITQN
jgi:hypothetical protein